MQGLVVIIAALLGAISWNLITWYFGLPSSSSHALIGGLVGAALASGSVVHWASIKDKVLIPMVVSPIVGFVVAFLVMLGDPLDLPASEPGRVNRGFRLAQIVSASAMALGHGLQDAQKTMGVIFLALVTDRSRDRRGRASRGGSSRPPRQPSRSAPTPVAGASCGRWVEASSTSTRLARSPRRPRPRRILYVTAYVYQAPVSTTHIITAG